MPRNGPTGPLGRTEAFHRAAGRMVVGSGVLLRGAPGTGRTTFARALADAGRRRGVAPLWVAPTDSLRAVPLGALSALLASDQLATASSAPDALAHAVTAIRFHGGAQPTVLVIDDAHLLDSMSADAVLQAVTTRATALVATVDGTTALTPALQRLVDDRFIEVVDLAPFDPATVGEVVAALLGGPPASSTVELLWRWSRGVPAVLAAIVGTGQRDGCFEPSEGQWWWRGPAPALDVVAEWLARRAAELGPAASEALHLVALAGWLDVNVLEGLVGAAALVELEATGLIVATDTRSGLMLRCADELTASTLVSGMAALRRRALAQRLLDSLAAPSGPEEVARSARVHLHTSAPIPPELMSQAISMARLADPHLARRLAEANHRWSPSVQSLVGMLTNHVDEGDLDGASELLDRAAALAATAEERRLATEAAFTFALFGRRDPVATRRLLAEPTTVEACAGDDPLLRSMWSVTELLSARPDRAAEHAEAVRGAASAGGLARLRADVTAVAASMLAGRTDAARAAGVEALPRADALLGTMPTATGMLRAELAFIALWRGDLTSLPTTEPQAGRWPAPPPVAPTGVERALTWALLAGIVAHLRGDHAEAVARLHEAVAQQSRGRGVFHAEACAWLVVALCDGGSRVEADAAMQRFPTRHLGVLPGLEEWAGGVLACAQGRTADGALLLRRAAERSRAVGAHLCEARYLVELAERCADDEHLARLDELSRMVDAKLLQLFVRTAIAGLKGDVDCLLACAAELAARGLPTRAAAACREAERQSGSDRRAAKRAAELRRTLRAPRHGVDSDHPRLSSRESEVAGLAAGGFSDRQIAARLIVSVRTVESHLASAYRKLGVSSRAELSTAMRSARRATSSSSAAGGPGIARIC